MHKYDIVPRRLTVDTSDSFFKNKLGVGIMKFEIDKSSPQNISVVQTLLDQIPDSWLSFVKKEYIFGCPDCGDQCGMYLEIMDDTSIKKFYIDNDLSKLSGESKVFAQNLKKTIATLGKTRN